MSNPNVIRLPGIRIRPKPDRRVPDDSIVVVVDKTRPLKQPKNGRPLTQVKAACDMCGYVHEHKAYHLQLRAGSVIVSPTIWGRLQGLIDCGGFEQMNTVEEPPTQKISMDMNGPGDVVLLEKYVSPIFEPVQGQA